MHRLGGKLNIVYCTVEPLYIMDIGYLNKSDVSLIHRFIHICMITGIRRDCPLIEVPLYMAKVRYRSGIIIY